MYGPPDTENPASWFAEMDRLLRGYGERELDKAADIVLRTHKGHRYPPVSEILSAAADARESLVDRAPVPDKFPDWSEEAIEKADELIRCEIGKRAADEGWVFALHTFCRKNRRLPARGEIGGCINEARGFDDAYSDNARQNTDLHRALNRLGDSMHRMRGYLGEIANGRIRAKDELREYLKSPAKFRSAA
jgi:hypothetical protein